MDHLAHTRRRLLRSGGLMLGAIAFLFGQETPGDGIHEGIRRQLELLAPTALREELTRFYGARSFAPAWTTPAAAEILLNRLSRADEEGLNTRDYDVQELRASLGDEKQEETGHAVLDVRLTLAYMKYSRDVRGGRVDPETLDRLWTPTQRPSDLAVELAKALRTEDVDGSLRRVAPAQAAYRQLREHLARLRRLSAARVWATAVSKRSNGLHERLKALGDISPEESETSDSLEAGLTRFQRRHGLPPSGEADQATVQALNVPLEERIRTIELNMERWRWLPDDLGFRRHILVNIAAFEAQVVERELAVIRIPAVVGRPYRRTPVFSARMSYLVFSPYWNVPNSIAVRDKLPLIQKDPEYLTIQGFRVFPKGNSYLAELDPQTIDWGALSADNFPYRLRQDPGPLNALGGVKFMFPNKYNVYLHDTPQRELFGESVRAFSSGCIRLERPFDLAKYLLRGISEWTDDKIRNAMNASRETTVVLPQPLPVHMVYFTAWVGKEGELNFRDDVYGRDALLADALQYSEEDAGNAQP